MANQGSNNPFFNPPEPSELPPSYEDAVASSPTSGGTASSASAPAPPTSAGSSKIPAESNSRPVPPTPTPSQPGPSTASALPAIARQFPPTFSLYSDGWGRNLSIGEHQENPLYAVRLHTGWSGEPPVVLHNGPDAERCPLLAAVDFDNWRSQMTVTLPPLPGMGSVGSEVRVQFDWGWHRVYRFAIEVGPDLRPEAFEWRHSYGNAIAGLGGAGDGWKLVRLAVGPPPGLRLGPGQAFMPGPFVTSDGKEAVAAWTDAMMSLTKRAKFAFLGTGLSGLLGERWAVMAVMTALGIWEMERRSKNRRRRA